MKKNPFLFKIVFDVTYNRYEIWFTDHTGEFVMSSFYSTFSKKGEVIESSCDDVAFISENVLWDINKLTDLGYKFAGIEKYKSKKKGAE